MSTLIVKGPIVSVHGTIKQIDDITPARDPVDMQTLRVVCPENTSPVLVVHLSGAVEDNTLPDADIFISVHNELEYMKLKEEVEDMRQRLVLKIFPSGALYAFIGWLTTREEVTHSLSRNHDNQQIAQLIRQFCDMQGWDMPPDGWYKQIKEFS